MSVVESNSDFENDVKWITRNGVGIQIMETLAGLCCYSSAPGKLIVAAKGFSTGLIGVGGVDTSAEMSFIEKW